MKKSYVILSIIFIFLLISVGCSDKDEPEAPTISKNEDSEYEHTFNNLNLGIVFDFDFYLPSADKRWVNLWVERYMDGTKDSQPLTQLSYGNSSEEVTEGNLGFGMINTESEDTLVFLYGPNASTQPSIIGNEFQTDVMNSWEYAIGNEEVKLKLGETKTLAVYRETKGNSMSTIDFQDEESLDRVIKQNEKVLLLKLRIEEKNED